MLSERSRHQLSRVISKNRRLTDRTLLLFLGSGVRDVRLYDCSGLSSTALQAIPRLAPALERLQLDYCGQLDSVAFRALGTLPHLSHLALYGAYLVRKEDWLAFFAEHGAQLTAFCLRETARFDGACVEALVRHAPRIHTLQLAQIGCLDDACVQCLAALPRLVHLDVSQPGVSRLGVPPASLTDAGVVPLLQRHTHLTSLHLAKNAALSSATVDAIGPHLTHLVADGLVNVSADAWIRLWKRCPHLAHLSLRGAGITDACVAALAQLPHLTTLNLNSNALTKAGLLALARVPLHTLDVGFVRSVDDELLDTLAASIPTLTKLYVFGCPRVTHFAHPRITVIGRERRA